MGSSDSRRFEVRGWRTYSIGIVCAIAALVVVALVLSNIDSTGGDQPNTAPHHAPSPLEVHAGRLEGQLAMGPGGKKLLLALMKAWINAGNERIQAVNTATQPIPIIAVRDLRAGLQAWNRYLGQAGSKATVVAAETASGTFLQLVEIGSRSLSEIKSNTAGAVRAQRIATGRRPTLFTLSNLAIYEYFDGNFSAGDEAARRAAADATPKSMTKSVEIQLEEYRERGKKFTERLRRAARALRESGKEQLPAPLKGFGSPAGLNGGE